MMHPSFAWARCGMANHPYGHVPCIQCAKSEQPQFMCLVCDRALCDHSCMREHARAGCRLAVAEKDIATGMSEAYVEARATSIGLEQFAACNKWTPASSAIPTKPGTYSVVPRTPRGPTDMLRVCGLLKGVAIPLTGYIDSVSNELADALAQDMRGRRCDRYGVPPILDADDTAALNCGEWTRIAGRFNIPVLAKPASVSAKEYLEMVCRLRRVEESALDADARTCSAKELSDARLMWACKYLAIK